MNDRITEGQVISLKSAFKEIKGVTDDACLWIACNMLKRDLQSLSDITRGEWQDLRDFLYPMWRDENWTLAPDARRVIADWYGLYREEVIGQRRLL